MRKNLLKAFVCLCCMLRVSSAYAMELPGTDAGPVAFQTQPVPSYVSEHQLDIVFLNDLPAARFPSRNYKVYYTFPGLTDYVEINRDTAPRATLRRVTGQAGFTLVATRLTPGTSYELRVCATAVDGSETVCSAAQTGKTPFSKPLNPDDGAPLPRNTSAYPAFPMQPSVKLVREHMLEFNLANNTLPAATFPKQNYRIYHCNPDADRCLPVNTTTTPHAILAYNVNDPLFYTRMRLLNPGTEYSFAICATSRDGLQTVCSPRLNATTYGPAPIYPEDDPGEVPAIRVTTVQELRNAIRDALPGDTIVVADGTYNLAGSRIESRVGGTAAESITVRAENANAAIIQTNGAEEAFQLYHPYYVFENLHVQVNGSGSYHAYKLNDDAHDVVIRGGRMEVFRGAESGIKGSSDGSAPYPDNLLVENTEIFYREPTTHVVAEGIDAIGVMGWVIRNNTFRGIRKADTSSVAWGILIKGNSQDTLVERNLFYDCDVAMSIGGTTGSQWFRDRNTTYEHRNGIVRNNISVNTRDVALYMERANNLQVYNNTFINSYTSGGSSSIDVRFSGSTATVRNNLLDKRVLNREGGTHTASNNVVMSGTYSVNDFQSVAGRDLRPRAGTALYAAIYNRGMTVSSVTDDKDGNLRPAGGAYDIGAYEIGAIGGTPPPPPAPPSPVCGNGTCETGETSASCVSDCPLPPPPPPPAPVCGNGTCESGETSSNCAADCPIPPPPPPPSPVCGNGSCESGETSATCANDCPATPPPGGGTSGDLSLIRQSSHGIPGFYLGQIGVADFDADGLKDVAIVGSWGPAYGPSTNGDACNQPQRCVTRIRLFRNASAAGGDIRFAQQQEFSQVNACKAGALVTGDFNGDGRPDIAYQFHNGTTDIRAGAFFNQGSWNFTQSTLPERVQAGTTSLGITAADVDRDGRDDLLFASSETYSGIAGGLWYRYTANNQWESRQSDFRHYITYGGTITAGDLTGDGYPEVAIGGNSNQLLGNQDCRSNLQYGHVFPNLGASGSAGFNANRLYALRALSSDEFACHGSDNASYKITDVDGDGRNDIIVAGSAPGFGQRTRPDYGNSHYSLSVMFNNGGGTGYTTWQNAQIDMGARNGYTTNSGVGNVEVPNIAAGDLNGDGRAEIFIQGHRRNQEGRAEAYDPVAPDGVHSAYYIHQTMLLRNNGNRTLTEADLNLPNVGEGGQAIADFNRDGKEDLIFGGALIPWHSNGRNCEERNTASTIITEVYRNASF